MTGAGSGNGLWRSTGGGTGFCRRTRSTRFESPFGLTQAELARLLRLGGNTISRWEAGRNVQTASMDMLVRLIRNLPGSLEYLRNHAA